MLRPLRCTKPIYSLGVSNTPIFDLEQDLPKPRSRPWSVWRSYALLGLVGLLFFSWAPLPSHKGLVYLLPAVYLGLVIHELGHAFGLRHCYNARCAMYYSNSIFETDNKMPHFCEICDRRFTRTRNERS